MRIATLFSGIGSPEQGAKRVYREFETVFACEFDKFARQSYEANYDIDPKHFHIDVNDLDATQYKDQVDILVWGFPCTSYSIAGLRKGMDDERTGNLFHEGLRVLKECMPKYTIIENVKGLLSIDEGKTIRLILKDLTEAGYMLTMNVVNTKDVGGNTPQSRERVFIIGKRIKEAAELRNNFIDENCLSHIKSEVSDER